MQSGLHCHADRMPRHTGQHTGRSVCKFMLIAMYQWFWKLKRTNGRGFISSAD